MTKKNAHNNFVVIYSQDDEEKAYQVVGQLSNDLSIECDFWSYKTAKTNPLYYEQVLKPAIEEADFLVFLLSNSCNNDGFVKLAYQQCVQLNKRIIPVNICNQKLRLNGYDFRTGVFNFLENSDKINLIDRFHSWIGLSTEYKYSETKHCPNCGLVIRTKAIFCKWCGKHFAEFDQRVCKNCGNPISSNSLYCGACGTKQ